MGAAHIRFLRDRAYKFKSRVLERGRIEKRKRIGKRNAVVRTECGSLCPKPVTVHIEVQALFCHVLIAVRRLLRHHVHVTLQNNRRLRFIALGSLLNDDYIVLLIPVVLEPSLLRKVLEVLADFLLLM